MLEGSKATNSSGREQNDSKIRFSLLKDKQVEKVKLEKGVCAPEQSATSAIPSNSAKTELINPPETEVAGKVSEGENNESSVGCHGKD